MKQQQNNSSDKSGPRHSNDEPQSDKSKTTEQVAPERGRYVAGADGTQEIDVPEDRGKQESDVSEASRKAR